MHINKKGVSGSSIIEMSFIMPLFLGIIVIVLHTIFYYHDKAVIAGAAAETAAVGVQYERRKENDLDLEQFFRERTERKLIYIRNPEVSVEKGRDHITVDAYAERSFFRIKVSQKAWIITPEKKIRLMEEIDGSFNEK